MKIPASKLVETLRPFVRRKNMSHTTRTPKGSLTTIDPDDYDDAVAHTIHVTHDQVEALTELFQDAKTAMEEE